MATATWKGEVIAESSNTVIVESNHYFPVEDVREGVLQPASMSSVCPWKGTAGYYDVVVADAVNAGAAWYYPDPKPEAVEIKDRVAFWRGVTVAA